MIGQFCGISASVQNLGYEKITGRTKSISSFSVWPQDVRLKIHVHIYYASPTNNSKVLENDDNLLAEFIASCFVTNVYKY